MATVFTEEDHSKLKENTSFNGKGYRGIRDEINKYFGVRYEYDTTSGDLVAQYVPTTIDDNFSGYKRRQMPKKFDGFGETGQACDLFGQFRFRNSSNKDVLIVGGENKMLAAYQMLKDFRAQREMEPIPVVAPTTGEKSQKQLQRHYQWLDRFERIILCFDNDKAGKEATELAAKVLPKGKVYVMDMTLKDPDSYLFDQESGKPVSREKEFINSFFKAKAYTPSGIVGSDGILEQMQERALTPKVPLPSFMSEANKMLAGGFKMKGIVNIVAGTSIGKTTLINAISKHWFFNCPYKVGIVTLEADVPEYGYDLLSEHVGRKLSLIEDPRELDEFLKQPEIVDKAKELFCNDDNSPRFYLIDDRGDFDSLQEKIEELIIRCGVQIIVIDPLSDALAGMTTDEQELWMKWEKQLKKSHDVLIVNVVHIRKSQQGQKDAGRGAELDESAMFGSSSIAKSADVTIFLERDKMAEDEIDRNTTKVKIPKARGTGKTGKAGEIYYENKTHRLHNKEEFFKENRQEF